MEGMYVSVFEIRDSSVSCDVDSAVAFFVYRYLNYRSVVHPTLNIVIDACDSKKPIVVDVSGLEFSTVLADDLHEDIQNCHLPVYYTPEENYCISGFCAVLRQLVKTFEADRWLLAFREACLSACAESSVWTKFCELDLIAAVRRCLMLPGPEIPVDVIRLELHMNQPVRTHNIRKTSARFPSTNGLPQHCYVEGPEMSLPDLIILPLIHAFFGVYGVGNVSTAVPLTLRWYQLMVSDRRVSDCLSSLAVPTTEGAREFAVPPAKNESLYKCDPRRYKGSDKVFTRQEDVDHAVGLVDATGILAEYEYREPSTGAFDWEGVPHYAHPKGGNLPSQRLSRKMQQIENIVKTTMKVAEDGDVIADFCCGTGHVGILIACLLPRCRVLLIDNKEHSLRRAAERIEHLNLGNVFIIQSNVDYFRGTFQIGVTLHACGVATDLVIKSCLSNRSKFVIAPCCYGKLQANHILTYPRSERLASSLMTVRDYMVVGHSADQTHKEEYAKSDQGEKCMKIVDVDRCLHAEENAYRVYLAKMKPVTCSPKNNFIVGVPTEKFQRRYFE